MNNNTLPKSEVLYALQNKGLRQLGCPPKCLLLLLWHLIESVCYAKHGVAGHHQLPCLCAALSVDNVAGIGQLVQDVEGIYLDDEIPLHERAG